MLVFVHFDGAINCVQSFDLARLYFGLKWVYPLKRARLRFESVLIGGICRYHPHGETRKHYLAKVLKRHV